LKKIKWAFKRLFRSKKSKIWRDKCRKTTKGNKTIMPLK
jgi:hypothetical protein